MVDFWEVYQNDLTSILALNTGGVGLWGGLLGGLAGGLISAWRMGYPIRRIMDLTAPAMLLSQAVGRVGDVINGEHCAKLTDAPWGFVYSHPESPAFSCMPLGGAGLIETKAMHSAVGYELIYDLLAFGFLYKVARGRIKPDGMMFALYLFLYGAGRLVIQTFFRLDDKFIGPLQEAQVISIAVLVVTGAILVWKARLRTAGDMSGPSASPSAPQAQGHARPAPEEGQELAVFPGDVIPGARRENPPVPSRRPGKVGAYVGRQRCRFDPLHTAFDCQTWKRLLWSPAAR